MSKLTALHEAMTRLDEAWAGVDDPNDLSREQLVAVSERIALVQRRLDAVHVEVAAGVARESRPELGAESLAKQHGFRNPATMLAATMGVSTGDARRLIAVGEGVEPRRDLIGARLPAKYPVIRSSLEAGRLSAQAAAMIIALLDRCRIAAGAERIAEGERVLADSAVGLGLDEVRKLITRAEAWLDPDGVEPRDEELRSQRTVTIFERGGMIHLNAKLDAESGAPVVAALRGYVTAAFAARKDAVDPDAPDADRRTVPMIQADALSMFCAHALGCTAKGLPLAGATVVVRMNLEDLQAGTGSALIDGVDQPVGAGVVRRMAAGGGVIPCVLGGGSEILDWGREKRLFTRAQRLALVERDGGCAMCGLPPEMTRAHHIRWWQRHRGKTDLSNGVLLCETCHHRIHDNGWDIRIDGAGVGARVWFIPPPYVDRDRTPRLGGRARFDIAA
ncbi:5-methylcytosine-specific restriction protein A [Microbacterium ginsengiterrae]|uniref:5-methylcytosine-specific restriction protein A n=1 Tax=Microbacterium ginsengiterrae TaxID=546115 RepID=A0A7W9CCG5_9MICO|nr:HNH endonuclease signature motif containing protein [Microbacterium ginsengiterrae]MBB5742896.1 5-methylcytosine-specific restriction protein A [Microbacterium ginsengiterrae]